VTHPLLKNSGGRDLTKSIELQTKQSQLTKYSETLKRKMTLAESEGVYWRLVLVRESIRTARENSERAKRLVDWNKKRVQTELADDADLVQAQSLWDLRNLELTIALDEERSVSHMFNTLRGVDKTQVSEELDKITPKLIEAAPIPQKLQEREDLTLARMSQELTQLGLDLASHKYDPSLDVFASYSLTGRDEASISKMAIETVGNQHPVWAVGFKFSTPIGAQSKELIGAWSKEKQATDLVFARKSYELNREWQDLVQRLDESRNRLKLVQKVEDTQNKKLELERDRQRRGRSTMFQVIQFETDLAQAQLNVIRNKSEILSILSRMKTFGGEG
jgi:outer membrane protein TolC